MAKKTTDKTEDKPILVTKNVKHVFTVDELVRLNGDFRRAYGALGALEVEFDSIKAGYKAKITEAESRMATLNASLDAGFEIRPTDCRVVFKPEDKEKDFYVEGIEAPVLTEPMTRDDYQQELLVADSTFENLDTVDIWPAIGTEYGRVVVGRIAGKWYAAARCSLGQAFLTERLDSEQKGVKERFDAFDLCVKRVQTYLLKNFRELAKGFEAPIQTALEAQKERVE